MSEKKYHGVRFAVFEADLKRHELRKHGVRVKLTEQPFQALILLLDHSGEVVTRVLMKAAGQTEKYFRHPYLKTGATMEAKTAFDQFLKERNYIVAPVTLDDGDFVFNDVLAKAIEKKDKKLEAKAREAYLEFVDASFDYAEKESQTDFNRQIPQTLLIHDNQINLECRE